MSTAQSIVNARLSVGGVTGNAVKKIILVVGSMTAGSRWMRLITSFIIIIVVITFLVTFQIRRLKIEIILGR